MTITTRFAAAGIAALFLLAGCSQGGDSAVSASSQATTPSSVASTVTTVSAGTATTTPSAATKVSANDASVAELQSAFEAAGISNAAKWAREVDEYRPYTSDPDLPKLRQELAKYNPAPEVVEQIVATLALP